MRISMIGQKGIPAIYGGVERHVHDLSVRVVRAGHEVTVYSRPWYTGQKGTYQFEGVRVKHAPSIKTKHLDTITYSLLATIDAIRERPDIIHYHGVGPSLVSWIPRLLAPKIKIITTFHSIDRYHTKWNAFAKFILRIGEKTANSFAHKTITISRSLQQYCLNEYHNKSIYIPNAVETDRMKTNTQIHNFGLTPQAYFVMVSRLVEHKGVHLLVKAFTRLKQEYPELMDGIKLAIVGGSAYTDEYVKSLHILAGITNEIVFTDFQSGASLAELYSNAKALVHPSLNEGLPLTVLHAMNYETPVLVSDIPEHLEIIKDTRMTFAENDVEAIMHTIKNFLEMNELEIEKVITANKKIVSERYSWDVIMPNILRLYDEQPTKLNTLKQVPA